MQDSFIFYRSFYESIKYLSENDQIQIYNAIMEYTLNEAEPELNGAAKALFIAFKSQIDANIKRRENGLKGGRPETEAKPNRNQNITDNKPNVNVNVNVNKNSNVNENYNDDDNCNCNDNVNAPSGGEYVLPRASLGTFTLTTPKENFYFNEAQIKAYAEKYPGIDIIGEFEKMQANISKMPKCNLSGKSLYEYVERWFSKIPLFENKRENKFAQRSEDNKKSGAPDFNEFYLRNIGRRVKRIKDRENENAGGS